MDRVSFAPGVWRRISEHLRSNGRVEDGAFFLFKTGRSATGLRVLVHEVLLPEESAWEFREHDRLVPSGQWMSAVLGIASAKNSGLGFVHSHPGEFHPASLSPVDMTTSAAWSKSIRQITHQPFVSLVTSGESVSGYVFDAGGLGSPRSVGRIEIAGEGMVRWVNPLPAGKQSDLDLDDRQIRALTTLGNERLRGMKIGVIGAGGTGSPLAEQLSRMGVNTIVTIDPDTLDTVSNLRRVVGSRCEDLGEKKASVIARHINSLGLSTQIVPVLADVREESAARLLLDMDLAILTTDTHSSRAFANQLAYQYWLPVIDVGVCVGTSKTGSVSGMPLEIRVLLPDNPCLWCRGGVLDPERIREENLPPAELKKLAAEGYVQGVPSPQPSLAALNYLAASAAAVTMLRLYSEQPVAYSTVIIDVWEQYCQTRDFEILRDCICHSWRGEADQGPLAFRPMP